MGFKLVLLVQNLNLNSDAVKTDFMQSSVCAYLYLLLIYVYTCMLFFLFLLLKNHVSKLSKNLFHIYFTRFIYYFFLFV